MRLFFLGLMACFTFLFSPHAAEAKRSGGLISYGHYGDLHFVAQTDITRDNTGPLSICVRAKTYHLSFINMWTSPQGYVLAENKCEAESFFDLPPEFLELGKVATMIPASVPDTPFLTAIQYAQGTVGTALIAMLVAVHLLVKFAHSRDSRARRKAKPSQAALSERLLTALCHAAKADGRIDQREIELIADVLHKACGKNYSQSDIYQVIKKAQTNLSEADFCAFGEGLTHKQRMMMVQAVLDTVAADGEVSEPEHRFAIGLAGALDITRSEFLDMLRFVPQPPTHA
ncbi:DUF533 domain-containing protein [Shimia haliotis]|uniref:Tellurite resistance protein TerB n=1 Tax=Shimia haliotis TaxID=1280847 RepID=A0A1I4CR04_9RHOB|nr:DUF533 domain-containing protein [Shimia haliotis]SFK83692.1 Tellurite resistance protein TerB [Shimia haliotis]